MSIAFGTRRAEWVRLADAPPPLAADDLARFEAVDLFYRSLCALLYNYVPMSGHPGGSISSGRFVAGILFDAMDYELAKPDRADADIVSYAAGHKAMGLYSMWALRDELARVGNPALLPADAARPPAPRGPPRLPPQPDHRDAALPEASARRPSTGTRPRRHRSSGSRPAPRASGVASSIGLALAAREYYGTKAPRVHVVEGEGGLTPGRVAEALAAAGAASLDNLVVHVDWNQASIDSNRVCREDGQPGDYVQWTPMELFYLHDWNVIEVPDGRDFQQVIAAQRMAASMTTGQPTAIVYRTVKGWRLRDRGPRLARRRPQALLRRLLPGARRALRRAPPARCPAARAPATAARWARTARPSWSSASTTRSCCCGRRSRTTGRRRRPWRRGSTRRAKRLDAAGRKARDGAPRVEAVYELASAGLTPPGRAGAQARHRHDAPRRARARAPALQQGLRRARSSSARPTSSARPRSTPSPPASATASGTRRRTRPRARSRSAASARTRWPASSPASPPSAATSASGSSYGAFLAPLGHIAARLHAIGAQAEGPPRPLVAVPPRLRPRGPQDRRGRAHPRRPAAAAAPAGELPARDDGHPHPVGPGRDLDAAGGGLPPPAGGHRPVRDAAERDGPRPRRPRPRPGRGGGDRRLPPPQADRARATRSRSCCRRAPSPTPSSSRRCRSSRRTASTRASTTWRARSCSTCCRPRSRRASSPRRTRARRSGITGFTLPTMFRWVVSDLGRAHTLHPFRKGHFLGSGQGPVVLAEAGLDGASQAQAIRAYVEARKPAAVAR